MVWEYIFDNEYKQRRDLQSLRTDAEIAASGSAANRRRLRHLQERVDRLELAVESLVRVLENRAGITKEELAVMTQWVDLADGVEDGRIGPDRSSDAPLCSHCGRPVNPRRQICIYCNGIIEKEEAKPTPKPPPRTVECTGCGKSILEVDSYFGDSGLLCGTCFAE